MARKYQDGKHTLAYTEPDIKVAGGPASLKEMGDWCRFTKRNGKVWVEAFGDTGLSAGQCRHLAERLNAWADGMDGRGGW